MKRLISFLTAAAAVCTAMPLTAVPASAAETSAAVQEDGAYPIPDFSCLGAVGSLSAEETKTAAEAVYQCLRTHQPEICFRDYGIEMNRNNYNELINIYRTVICGWDAGILAISNHLSYSPVTGTMAFFYYVSDAEYDAQYAAYTGMLDEILSGVQDEWSDAEKALYLHDYIALHYDYDYEAYYGRIEREDNEEHSAYGILKNGVAVCDGYANLYSMLLNRLGINTLKVSSNDLDHAWNMVCIDGSWYYVDVTWDDIYTQYAGVVRHSNFLRTAEELSAADHTSTDWLVSYMNDIYSSKVPDTFSNAFWLQSDSVILRWQDAWVTVGREAPCTLSLHRNIQPDGTSECTPFCELEFDQYKWSVWDKPGYTYTRNYVVPAVIGDTLFFTTPAAIYAVQSPEQTEPVLIYALSESEQAEGYLYGLYAKGDTLYYGIDRSIRQPTETLSSPVPYYALRAADWSAALLAGDLRYDLNGDSSVTVLDAVALARYVNESAPEGSFEADRADLDQDSIISLSDLMLMLEYLLSV